MYKIASVLVVDDEEMIRRTIRRVLTRAGYEVREATNGWEAINSFKANPVDLVITDMYMPGSDGLDVILRLRSDFPKTKFIAISGGGLENPEQVLEAAINAGAVWTLPKPFSMEALLRTLTDCFTPLLRGADVN